MKQSGKNNCSAENLCTSSAHSNSQTNVRKIVFVGIMGAVSTVLLLFRFPIPFFPPFLDFDLSGVAEMLGGFMFGPVAGLSIAMIKILLKLVMQGSTSIGTGEIQLVILSFAYLLPALILYKHSKTKKAAVTGLIISTITVSIAAVLSNYYIIIPFYANLSGMTMSDFVSMCNAVNPLIKSTAGMLLIGILPFNLIKYGVSSLITIIIYKKTSRAVKQIIFR